MRIVIDARCVQPHFPGIGRYVLNLLSAMAEDGAERTIAVIQAGSENIFPSGITSISVPAGVRSLREQWAIPRAMRKLSPMIYHAPYFFRSFLVRVPTVVTIHDLIPILYPYGMPSRIQRWTYQAAIRLSISSASLVLTPSNSSRQSLVDRLGVHPSKVIVTPYGVEPRFCHAAIEDIPGVRARYGLPDQYLLYVGVNKPHKNLGRLIRAFARVARARPEKLVLAGPRDPRYRDVSVEIERLELNDRVTELGVIDDRDLPALYAGATLFVFPSLHEGFGLPVLEAMSSGTPVVCSAASSLLEIAGEATLMFDPYNIDSISDSLLLALEDHSLREKMRDLGLEQSRKFTWQSTARLTIQAYRGIVT